MKKNFFERLIVGNSSKIQRKKIIKKRILTQQKREDALPHSFSVSDLKKTLRIPVISQENKESLVNSTPRVSTLKQQKIDTKPIPFNEDALFVPLRSSYEFKKETPLQKDTYFYIDGGTVLTSIEDLLEYIESPLPEHWDMFVQKRGEIIVWVESVFVYPKLSKLLNLADTKAEAVAFIRSVIENPKI